MVGAVRVSWIVGALAALVVAGAGHADPAADQGQARAQAALDNVASLQRPGEDGYATVWDGDKYVQCKFTPRGGFRCEAGGALMQPSLAQVLSPERIGRLAALGWRLDPSFGAYVRKFPAGVPTSAVAQAVLQALAEGYDADVSDVEVESRWVASEPCPPRNGPTQNLAGMVDDAPSMAGFLLHACAYVPSPDLAAGEPASAAALVSRYGSRVAAEIQRLRVNASADVFVVFESGIGYVQCQPQTSPDGIYCEAQSAESWPALRAVLTPDRIARLHAAGYADPGRAPNYARNYPTAAFTDAAIASELLTILHDVYGYDGAQPLSIKTEAGDTL
jgi:hypothetical protein